MSLLNLSRLTSRWSEATKQPPEFDEERSREQFCRAVRARASQPSRVRHRLPAALAAAAALLLVVGALGLWHANSRETTVAVTPGAWLETRSGERLPMRFAEGTEVVVHATSRVHVESVDPRGASMVLERGTVSASVVHRGDTQWSFAAGPFRVRFTGTKLRVSWNPTAELFDVRVSKGSVVVTGPLLQGERRVKAGERCSVALRERRLEVAQRPNDTERKGVPHLEVRDLPVLDAGTESPSPTDRPLPTWHALERSGRYAEAVAAAEAYGLARIYQGGSSDELMSLARAARLANRHSVAMRALLACRQRFAGSRHAATAAFILGRGAAPSAAAGWFATYLRERPGGQLAREAAGRLIESYHQAGDFPQAQRAAREYLRRYPSGPHAAFARSVLGG